MDLYVESQAVDAMKKGDTNKFLFLMDGYFDEVYRYVERRIGKSDRAQEILRLTFLDALGQIQNTPSDMGYAIWLFSLARQRCWEEIGRGAFPQKQGLMDANEQPEPKAGDMERFEKMMGKLSLEEREILRLKFFEQVTDGDVMFILGVQEGTIGQRIYRVLKRAHFLLFGESDEGQGVYFGELSGFLSRIRAMENIEIPVSFKLNLKTDLSNRIERRSFAMEAEEVPKEVPATPPFTTKADLVAPKGSQDPAKIFVEAVREMREEEQREQEKERMKLERYEQIFDFVDRWKHVLLIIPIIIFVTVAGFLFYQFLGKEPVKPNGNVAFNPLAVINKYVDEDVIRNLLAKNNQAKFDQEEFLRILALLRLLDNQIKKVANEKCSIEVLFRGQFSDDEIKSVNENINNRLCDHFKVNNLLVLKTGDDKVEIAADVPNWILKYRFVNKNKVEDWRIKKYERDPNSDQKSGKIPRGEGIVRGLTSEAAFSG